MNTLKAIIFGALLLAANALHASENLKLSFFYGNYECRHSLNDGCSLVFPQNPNVTIVLQKNGPLYQGQNNLVFSQYGQTIEGQVSVSRIGNSNLSVVVNLKTKSGQEIYSSMSTVASGKTRDLDSTVTRVGPKLYNIDADLFELRPVVWIGSEIN